MWTWLRLRGRTQTHINSFSESCQRLHRLSPWSWAAQLYELWNLHLYSFNPHKPFKFMQLQQAAPSTQLQCLFLSHGNKTTILQANVMTVHSSCSQTHPYTPFAHIPEPPAQHPCSSSRSLGVSVDGYRVLHFPNTVFNKSLVIKPPEYKINILNNKWENKTVLQRTSWTSQRKF